MKNPPRTIGRRSRIAMFLIAGIALNALLVFAAVNHVGAASAWLAAAGAQDQLVIRGGVIRVGHASNRDNHAYSLARVRIPNTGIYLHDNTSHASVGIRALTMTSRCDLVIWMDDDLATEHVVSIDIDEDETLSRLQVVAGGSGGAGKVTVPFHRLGKHLCANSRTFGRNANIWVTVTHLRE